MSEGLTIFRDFALVMVVVGATSLLFRALRQPAILGYVLAGVIVGPFTLGPTVRNLESISQLADLGVVLLMFGLGLEFSLDRLRRVGLVAVVAATLEVFFMLAIGYQAGILLGWTARDALFLGAALAVTSTMVVVKVLTELGRLRQEASRIIVGILVADDFAGVAMIAFLSGIATTGRADLAGAGLALLTLGLFAVTSIGLGALLVPRVMALTRRASREGMLVIGLALCFGLALLSQRLGLSVAAGAFLMGSIIASTARSDEMVEMVTPLRDVFASIFFVAMGMLLDIRLIPAFLLPALVVVAFNFLGKIFSLSLGTLLSGYSAKTAVQVGMGMVVIGEYSLIMLKVGLDAGAIGEVVFPVVIVVSVLTTLSSPYLMRLSDPLAERLDRALPRPVRESIIYGGLLGRAFRRFLSGTGPLAQKARRHLTLILLNILVIAVLWGTTALVFYLGENLLARLPLGPDLLGLLAFLGVLVLSLPSLGIIWRHLRSLVQLVTEALIERQGTARFLSRRVVARVVRDAVLAFIALALAIPLLPLAVRLRQEGSLLLFLPLLAAAIVIAYLFWDAIHQIHCRLETVLHRTLLGEGQASGSCPEEETRRGGHNES